MFRKISLIGILSIMLIILTFGLFDGTFLYAEYNPKNDLYNSKLNLTETQFKMIRAGLSASSSHNMQPWKVKIIDDNTFQLYGDTNKLLPVVDPNNWQFYVSQGTFIQNVKDYALKAGIDLEVEYEEWFDVQSDPLIATFKHKGSSKIDVVSSATTTVDGKGKAIEVLLSEYDTHSFEYHYVKDDDELDSLLLEATKVESNNEDAMVELLDVFRFTKWDKNRYRYGLGLNMNDFMLQTFLGPIMKWTSEWQSFGQAGIKMFETRLNEEVGHIIITQSTMEGLDYIKLGESVSKLVKEKTGYVIRPEIQLLQPIEGMPELKESLDLLIGNEVVFILGVKEGGNETNETIRHNVQDILFY